MDVTHLEEYFVYLHTQHRRLHRFFGWVESRGYIESNPLKLIPRPRLEEPVVPTVTDTEMQRLLRQVNPKAATTKSDAFRAYRDRAILLLLCDTPARRSELVGLTLSDVDLEEKVITVRGKFARDRTTPLGNVAAEAVWDYLQRRKQIAPAHRIELWVDYAGRGLSQPIWLYPHLTRLDNKAGIANLHTHRFRPTYAMTALRGGMPEHVLM